MRITNACSRCQIIESRKIPQFSTSLEPAIVIPIILTSLHLPMPNLLIMLDSVFGGKIGSGETGQKALLYYLRYGPIQRFAPFATRPNARLFRINFYFCCLLPTFLFAIHNYATKTYQYPLLIELFEVITTLPTSSI